MSEAPEEIVTAALTFKVPQKVGWSVQREDQSWAGDELLGLVDFLVREAESRSITLSLSLIFESHGNDGTAAS